MTRAEEILESVDAIIDFKRKQGWLPSEEEEKAAPEKAAQMKADAILRHFEGLFTPSSKQQLRVHQAQAARGAVVGSGVSKGARQVKMKQMKQAGATRPERRAVKQDMKQQRKNILRTQTRV